MDASPPPAVEAPDGVLEESLVVWSKNVLLPSAVLERRWRSGMASGNQSLLAGTLVSVDCW